jgi:hypothetical protein
MKVTCTIEEIELESDDGGDVPGVRATCTRCDRVTESFGTSEASIKRCLALMREECEYDEENFYVADDDQEKIR